MKRLMISALSIVLTTLPISAEVVQLQCKMPYRDTYLVTIDYGENTLSLDLMNDIGMIDRLPYYQKLRAIIASDDIAVEIDGARISYHKRTRILREVKNNGDGFDSKPCQSYAQKP